MLYEIAHVVKERMGFVWDAVEWGNAKVFALQHHGQFGYTLPSNDKGIVVREATLDDVSHLVDFFQQQPADAFRFFKPHGFDAVGLRKVIRNRSFLAFVACDAETVVGYCFMRSFVNGTSYRGYMVDHRQRGRGIGKLMGRAMNVVGDALGLRMYKSIAPENRASMGVTKSVCDIRILKTLDNGDMLVECFTKCADNQHVGIGGGNAAYLVVNQAVMPLKEYDYAA